MSSDGTQAETGPQPELSRRGAIGRAGLGAVAMGAIAAGIGTQSKASAQTADMDPAILNFALNLEYLEAEFYVTCVTGAGLAAADQTGLGKQGPAVGAQRVNFLTPRIKQLAEEIADDEYNHVRFLRSALGSSAYAQPTINLRKSFRDLGVAAGLPFTFDPYKDELSFLLGAYVFEDVGVTAYNGAAPLITSKAYLGAAASIMAVEAYHAAGLRTLIYEFGLSTAADKIAALRAAASGTGPGTSYPADDEGPTVDNRINLVTVDSNSLAYARTTSQVLSVVYLGGTTHGGFYPDGMNGPINSVS